MSRKSSSVCYTLILDRSDSCMGILTNELFTKTQSVLLNCISFLHFRKQIITQIQKGTVFRCQSFTQSQLALPFYLLDIPILLGISYMIGSENSSYRLVL